MSHPITLAEARQIAIRAGQNAKAERDRDRAEEAQLFSDESEDVMTETETTPSELADKAKIVTAGLHEPLASFVPQIAGYQVREFILEMGTELRRLAEELKRRDDWISQQIIDTDEKEDQSKATNRVVDRMIYNERSTCLWKVRRAFEKIHDELNPKP